MSVSKKPRVLAGSPSGSVPIGYWTSVEVMNELLLHYWGERAYQHSGRLFSYEVSNGNFIRELEQSAHLRECCDILRQALCNGYLEALVRKDGSEPERIPPDCWTSVPRKDLRINFALGEAFAGFDHDSPLKPLEGAVFLFEATKVEPWLERLASDHTLPNPLWRAGNGLKHEAYVTQCEAIYWLADGVVKSAPEALIETIDLSNYADERLNASKLEEFGDWHPELIEIEDFVAKEMARAFRITRVRNLLRELIANRELEAFGCFVDGTGREHGLSKIDPDFFLHAVHLSGIHDQISVDANAEYEAYQEAREAGYWQSVRFRRGDLTAIWGEDCKGSSGIESTSGIGTMQAVQNKVALQSGSPGRPNKGVTFASKYVEIYPDGHELVGHTWKQAIREVSSRANLAPVDVKTLKRALHRRK